MSMKIKYHFKINNVKQVFIGNESVPIQLPQCWFRGLAISNDKIEIYFPNKTYGSNFIKQHTRKQLWFEITKMLTAFKNKFILLFIIIFGTFSFPVKIHTYMHTYIHPFNGPFSRTTRVSRYQKGKTNLDFFTEARDSEWQWHQLGHMQVCTSLQIDNHASTPPLSFLQTGCPSCRPTNSVKALKASPC